VLTDDRVETLETSRAEAERLGAVAFFGDKYGDLVRVVRAGPHSLEFCGGTHVAALGQIGPIAVVSEGSISANTRRIFAVTAEAAIERDRAREALLREAAELLRTEPENVVEALERLLDRQRAADKELQRLRGSALESEAAEAAAGAEQGVAVVRRDGRPPEELRNLAQAVRRREGVTAAVVGGTPDGVKASLAVATTGDPDARAVVKQAAAVMGGGGGGSPEIALAGGKDPTKIDEALAEARRLLIGG
jgi:alanyl-tRNA synthetase